MKTIWVTIDDVTHPNGQRYIVWVAKDKNRNTIYNITKAPHMKTLKPNELTTIMPNTDGGYYSKEDLLRLKGIIN